MHVEGTLERGPLGFAVRSGTGLTKIGYPRRASRLIGRPVKVEGRRMAFDEITCDRIWEQGKPRPTTPYLPSIEHALIAVPIVYGLLASVASLVS
jgi:hypothetical protein